MTIMGDTTGMSAKKPQTTDLAQTMRRAFHASDLTMYAVAKLSGVDRAQVVRFFSGNRGLTLGAASRICEVLGLELRPVRKPKRKG